MHRPAVIQSRRPLRMVHCFVPANKSQGRLLAGISWRCVGREACSSVELVAWAARIRMIAGSRLTAFADRGRCLTILFHQTDRQVSLSGLENDGPQGRRQAAPRRLTFRTILA